MMIEEVAISRLVTFVRIWLLLKNKIAFPVKAKIHYTFVKNQNRLKKKNTRAEEESSSQALAYIHFIKL